MGQFSNGWLGAVVLRVTQIEPLHCFTLDWTMVERQYCTVGTNLSHSILAYCRGIVAHCRDKIVPILVCKN